MVTNELSEGQFNVIKNMCKSKVYVVLSPHNQAGDPEEVRDGYIKNQTMFNDLVRQGFMRNITNEFSKLLSEAREKGGRTFDAYALEPVAIQMFEPPEGLVN